MTSIGELARLVLVLGAIVFILWLPFRRSGSGMPGRSLIVGPRGVKWIPVGVAATEAVSLLPGDQSPQFMATLFLAVVLTVAMRWSATEVVVAAAGVLATVPLLSETLSDPGATMGAWAIGVVLFAFPLTIGLPVATGLAVVRTLTPDWLTGRQTVGDFALMVWGLCNVFLLMVQGEIFRAVGVQEPPFLVMLGLSALLGFAASVVPALAAPLLGIVVGLVQILFLGYTDPAVAWLDFGVFIVVMAGAAIGSGHDRNGG